MKNIDLKDSVKDFSSGWVVLDSKNKVVGHARSLPKIMKKAEKIQEATVMPVAKNYQGFVTKSS